MSIHELDAKVKDLRELRNFEAEIKAEIAVIEDELKAEMLARNTDTLRGAGLYRDLEDHCHQPLQQRGLPADPCGAVPAIQQGHHQPPAGDRLTENVPARAGVLTGTFCNYGCSCLVR